MSGSNKLYFGRLSGKQLFLLLVPIFLLTSTYYAFQFFSIVFGLKLGYLSGFLFYWIVWCMVVPYALLKREGIKRLFRRPEKRCNGWIDAVLLVIPCIFAIFGGPFLTRLPGATFEIVILSFLIALVNALSEEVLWRGTYFHFFKKPVMGFIFPLVGFSIWHVAPNSVNPSSYGVPLFVLFSGILAVFWGIVAYRTKSIRWVLLSHIIVDFSGFGAMFYLSNIH